MGGHRAVHGGGIRGLHRLLTEHGEALEADLAQYYGIDLRDLFRGSLTWRRLGVLIRGLPVDSRLTGTLPRSEPVDDAAETVARWSHIEYLLADLYDLLVAVHSKDKQTPYPRPGHRPVTRRANPERVAQLRRRTGREVV